MTIEAVTFAQQLQAGQIKIGADKALSYGRPPKRLPLWRVFRLLQFKQMIEYSNEGFILPLEK